MSKSDMSLEELEEERIKLEKEYISYLEVDMNKQAALTNRRIHRIQENIDSIIAKKEFENRIRKLKEYEMYGIKQEMIKKIEIYEKFIKQEGLEYRLQNFIEEQENKKEDEEELI